MGSSNRFVGEKEGCEMRRIAVVVAALMVCVMAVVGCGGQTKEAKEYMTKADNAFENLDKVLSETSKKSNDLLTKAFTGDISGIQSNPKMLEEMSATLDNAIKELEKVSSDYAKIRDLKGVEDYVEYANAMINAIKVEIELVKAGQQLIAKLAPIAAAGDWVKFAETIKQSAAEATKITELTTKVDKLLKDAREIKSEKKLGES